MEDRYPWYESYDISKGRLVLQGDLIPSCPLLVPQETLQVGVTINTMVVEYNVVILTQSCDLIQSKVNNVLVAPYFNLCEILSNNPDFTTQRSKRSFFDKVKQGVIPNYHLLNIDTENSINDYLIVDFRNVYAIHINALMNHITIKKKWIRLNSPYKEHLSQAFARYLMRVGLPMDLTNPY